MVRLYIARVRDAEDISCLSSYRFEKLSKLKNAAAYRESVCAEILLIKALELENRGFTLPLDIQTIARGKPEVNGAGYHISLSHAAGYVLCAVADCPVGADIEGDRNVDLRLSSRYLSPDEREKVQSVDDFLRIWVQKESFIKASGLGLAQDMRSFSVFDEPKKYRYIKHGDLHIAAYSPCGEDISDAITEIEI